MLNPIVQQVPGVTLSILSSDFIDPKKFHRESSMAITLPVGLLFRPTDEEIIKHYLLKKQMGEELPLNGVIQEGDVFSEEVLSEVFRSSETHVYFFTQLKKKSVKGSIHDRTVGKATWRCQSVTDIRVDEETVIGKKRVLDYSNPGSVGHHDWNMKEFSLDGVLLEHPQTVSSCSIRISYMNLLVSKLIE